MKYILFIAGIFFVSLSVLGLFLLGPTKAHSIANFYLSFNKSAGLFLLGNLSLGLYYLEDSVKNTKWYILVILFLFAVLSIFL